MKTYCWPMEAGSSSEGAKPNDNADAADCHHCSTGTLKQDKEEACKADNPRAIVWKGLCLELIITSGHVGIVHQLIRYMIGIAR